jgi:excisionase family DNA binding protein
LVSLALVSRRRLGPQPADLITIAEAARLLAVSLPTLRRWDESGKFKARRHPINSYRMYLRTDVLKLRKRIVDGKRAA